MTRTFSFSTIVPRGFVVQDVRVDPELMTLVVHHESATAMCPSCGTGSNRLHSRYRRSPMDLPLGGRRVRLSIIARRFRCASVLCSQHIFAERFPEGVLAPSARRTGRLDHVIHHLGLALDGRPAASFARRLVIPVSNDTLLRVVRRRATIPKEPLKVVGIDDWAWRRNHRYGTMVCDLERRRPVILLPDREQATSEAWLASHPSITIVARDRGGGYGEAVARALPHATQFADRWHLMQNASRAFVDAVRKSMRQIRSAIGATVINPDLLTAAERIQYEGYLRREEENTAVLTLWKEGVPIRQIVRRTGHHRGTVRRIIRGERSDVFRSRHSTIEAYLPWLDAQWDAGARNAAALCRALREQGFRGSVRVVAEWATRRRRAEKVDAQSLTRVPSARTIARLMTIGRTGVSKSESVMIAAIEEGIPTLVEARQIIADFHEMIRKKAASQLTALAGPRLSEPRSVLRKWRKERRARCSRRNNGAMVQRPNGRTSHATEAGQTPDVRAREDRSPAGKIAWRCINGPDAPKLRQSLAFKPVDEIDDIEEATAGAATDKDACDRDGKVGLPGPGAADQHDVALLGEEAAGSQVADERLVDGRSLER